MLLSCLHREILRYYEHTEFFLIIMIERHILWFLVEKNSILFGPEVVYFLYWIMEWFVVWLKNMFWSVFFTKYIFLLQLASLRTNASAAAAAEAEDAVFALFLKFLLF